MKTRKLASVFLLFVCVAILGGCSGILQGRDAELLGKWRAAEKDDDYTFSNAEMTILTNGYTITAKYGVDTSVTPHLFDMKIKEVSEGPDAGTIEGILNLLGFSGLTVLEGLYEIDGDELRMVLSPKIFGRPTSIPDSQDGIEDEMLIEATRVLQSR